MVSLSHTDEAVSLMRLLFVNYEFPPVGGGAAYASLATARELVAMGHRVDFLTAATPGMQDDQEIDGVQVLRVRCHRRSVHDIGLMGALSFVAFAAPRLRALATRHRYDAIHYYFGLPTGLLSLVPGAHRARPYIVSLRGSDVPGYTPNLKRYHRWMLPFSRRIWRGPAARCAPSGGRILTVSRLIERKGLDTLIEALALARNRTLSLDIAGEGPEGGALRELAQCCGVADRVRFHGFVDRAELASLYAQADMFALVSRAESCSMAMLEAMAAGLAIVASRVGGNVELIQDQVNGMLVESENVAALASALSSLAAQPQQRRRFGDANRELVARRYGWRLVAQRYESVFKEIVRSPATVAAAAEARLAILQRRGIDP
jgi:glycosyltransferase involved in cell wall biosynthesis